MDAEVLRARRERQREEVRRRRVRTAVLAATLLLLVAAGALALLNHGSSSPTPRVARSGTVHGRSATGTDSTTAASPGTQAGTAAHAAATPDGPPGKLPVPILMYHMIAAPPAGAPFPGLYVPPQEFEEQMRALEQAGWHAVTMDQVESYWRSGTPLGAGKPIVLSFDNGYQSQYTRALPILRGLGWVGDENLQLTGLPPSQGGLGDDEIRGLIAAGWELDTQGISHADLITLDAAELRHQVATAREQLRRRFGVPVNWFCYPSGHYDATVVAAVRQAGFVGSTTVVPGWAHPQDDSYRLHRLRVLGGTTGSQLLALLAAVREDPASPPSYGSA